MPFDGLNKFAWLLAYPVFIYAGLRILRCKKDDPGTAMGVSVLSFVFAFFIYAFISPNISFTNRDAALGFFIKSIVTYFLPLLMLFTWLFTCERGKARWYQGLGVACFAMLWGLGLAGLYLWLFFESFGWWPWNPLDSGAEQLLHYWATGEY